MNFCGSETAPLSQTVSGAAFSTVAVLHTPQISGLYVSLSLSSLFPDRHFKVCFSPIANLADGFDLGFSLLLLRQHKYYLLGKGQRSFVFMPTPFKHVLIGRPPWGVTDFPERLTGFWSKPPAPPPTSRVSTGEKPMLI